MSLDLDPTRWHPDTIRGRRVYLERHRPEQFPDVLRWYRDPEVARLTRFQIGPVSDEEVRRFFQTRLLSPDAFAYAIRRADDDRLIGTTTLSALDADNGSVLFHITIGERDSWSQGFGSEAIALMVGHAFDALGLHRVGLSVFEFNPRAIRAYEKVGFRVEGRSREALWRDGAYWDEIHMGILEGEWRSGWGRRDAVEAARPEKTRVAAARAEPGVPGGRDGAGGRGEVDACAEPPAHGHTDADGDADGRADAGGRANAGADAPRSPRQDLRGAEHVRATLRYGRR